MDDSLDERPISPVGAAADELSLGDDNRPASDNESSLECEGDNPFDHDGDEQNAADASNNNLEDGSVEAEEGEREQEEMEEEGEDAMAEGEESQSSERSNDYDELARESAQDERSQESGSVDKMRQRRLEGLLDDEEDESDELSEEDEGDTEEGEAKQRKLGSGDKSNARRPGHHNKSAVLPRKRGRPSKKAKFELELR